MSENSYQERQSFFSKYKWYIIGIIGFFFVKGFFSDSDNSSSSAVEYDETEIIEPTEGVITDVKEVQDEIFKITDEKVVPTVEESRIVATYMDGGVDTFTLEEVALVDTTIVSEDKGYRRRSSISILLKL